MGASAKGAASLSAWGNAPGDGFNWMSAESAIHIRAQQTICMILALSAYYSCDQSPGALPQAKVGDNAFGAQRIEPSCSQREEAVIP